MPNRTFDSDGALAVVIRSFIKLAIETMTDRLPNKRIKPKALAPGAPRGDPSSASSTTEFRVFTISTKTALYDWMKDQMERKPDVYSRLPSRSYFYEILREFTKDGRVRFHRTTNFTKCDVCLWCRHHLGIGKHGSEFRDNVRRLRVLHLNHIASEVQCVFYINKGKLLHTFILRFILL